MKFFDAPVLPGIYFGIVICCGVYLWATRNPFELFVVLACILLAWISAFRTTELIHQTIMNALTEAADKPGFSPPLPHYALALCGIAGGLVGSLITAFGVSIACKKFRTFENWARTITVGTVAGVLLELLGEPASLAKTALPIHIGSLLPLFLVWQMAVAASIGYGIVPQLEYPKPNVAVSL